MHSRCKALAFPAILSIAALLVGCGRPQLPSVSPTTVAPQDAYKNQTLLYAADAATGTIYVLRYPQGTLVEKFSLATGSGDPLGECVGSGGNVFIVSFESGNIYRYEHGGTTPIATLEGTGTAVDACSVNPTNGDLAAVSPLTGAAYIWHNARGVPSVFLSSARLYYCGYDAQGNLFMDGTAAPSLKFALFELPKRGTTIKTIHLNRDVKGVGQIQWDGSYVSIEDTYRPNFIYRVRVAGSSGKVIGTIHFQEKLGLLAQSWVYGGMVIVPFSVHGANTSSIGLWNYPAGGPATAIWKHVGGGGKRGTIGAVAISPAH